MKPLILLFLFLATLPSYSADDEDTYKVLNDVFVDLVDTTYFYQYLLPIPMSKPKNHEDSLHYNEYLKILKEEKKQIDSIRQHGSFDFFIENTFANYKDFYTRNLN